MDYRYQDMLDSIYDLVAYCPRHPGQVISNGMFDAPCGACEMESEDAYISYLENSPTRTFCTSRVHCWGVLPTGDIVSCLDSRDSEEIPF